MNHIKKEDQQYIMNTYRRLDLVIEKAEGCYLYDHEGNPYLDMYAGIAVNNLGHDKALVQAMMEQAMKYVHLSNYFVCEPVVRLAKLLVEHTFASKVFFTNSGTEANEAAIKLCKKRGREIHPEKIEMLSAFNSFHGRTNGALTLTGQSKYQDQFQPLLPGVDYFNFNDIEELRGKVSEKTCAVFLEIIQGEGGVLEVSQAFMDELVRLSNVFDFLIVIDEVQTGMGRCGDLFAYETYGFKPDLLTVSKSVGGGLPLGVLLAREGLDEIFLAGDHGSTFAPNPVSCAGGEYLLRQLVSTNMLQEVKQKGDFLLEELHKLKQRYPEIIRDIRGRGLMIGIDVGQYAVQIKQKAQQHNVLLNSTNESVIRLLPPLTIGLDDLNVFLKVFETVLGEISND